MTTAFASGTYSDLTFEQYLAIDAMSQTVLKAGRTSMAHLKTAIDTPPTPPTDAMLIGSALHCAFLEPELMLDKIVVWEGKRRAGKEWDAFKEKHAGKLILTPSLYTQFQGMLVALRAHRQIREWLAIEHRTEVSVVADLCEVRCKGRIDVLLPEVILDLKKTRNAGMHSFQRSVLEYGYHIQAALYIDLLIKAQPERGLVWNYMIVAVEDKPPYDVCIYQLDDDTIDAGDQEVLRLLSEYKRCMRTDNWPGRHSEIVEMGLPDWARDKKMVFTVHGETVPA